MNIQKLKTMISEPASKEWFAKHGSPQNKALTKSSVESPRAKHVRETNERNVREGMMAHARQRHERRHGSGGRTSKSEALERAKLNSKER